MSDHTLRPIWTPDDYQETRRASASHHAQPDTRDGDPPWVRRADPNYHDPDTPQPHTTITVSWWRTILAALSVAVLTAVGVLWLATEARAETFTTCPSGLSGVATTDTSCAFADNVRRSFYLQPSWTIITTSPVTGKFYTMQCSRTVTDVWEWDNPKRCVGVNDSGAVLVVYIA